MSKKGNIIFLKYRHLIFAIIILIMVIILDIIFVNYSKKPMEEVENNIKIINNMFEKNDYDISKLKKHSKKAKDVWSKKSEILSCFIEHEEVDEINTKLGLLEVEIKNKNWEDARIVSSEVEQLVKYLNIKQKVSFQNLF